MEFSNIISILVLAYFITVIINVALLKYYNDSPIGDDEFKLAYFPVVNGVTLFILIGELLYDNVIRPTNE